MRLVMNILFSVVLLVLLVSTAFAVTVKEKEMKMSEKWMKESFQRAPVCKGEIKAPGREVGLDVICNYDPVMLNNRLGGTFNINGKIYTKGIFSHANSNIKVVLPDGVKRISAEIGLDKLANGGSVIAVIKEGNTVLFDSGLILPNMEPIIIDIPLNNPTDINLIVNNADDGIACDQLDWANIKVVLENGEEVYLGDMSFIIGQDSKPTERYNSNIPFSFEYGGVPSDLFLFNWRFTEDSVKIDENKNKVIQIYTDPVTKLELRCERVDYRDFPVSEWTIYFKNRGNKNTPIISNIKSMDFKVKRTGKADFLLHHANGSPAANDDYRPMTSIILDKTQKTIATSGGKPTNTAMPYFNLETGNGGVIAVIGWPGQWSCDFIADNNTIRIAGGMEKTRFFLYPDEEVRTPLNVVMNYEGDWERAQNIWRQFMYAHNLPKQAEIMQVACSSHWYNEMVNADTASQINFIDRYLEEGFPIKYWWMDAGWYICDGSWGNTGTWEVDKTRFSKGLREVSDYAHSKGIDIITWFEPERIGWAKSDIATGHPQWLLGGNIFDMGNDDARKWMTDHVSKIIEDEGIDLYRQDHNAFPLNNWRAHDESDRDGITEIRNAVGYLAYWDSLLARFPNMLIDSCASGGRRNDLETMRRSVPLWRTDYLHEPVGLQNHTYGMNYWIPYAGSGGSVTDTYTLRSIAVSSFNSLWDLRRKDLNYDELRKFISDLQTKIAPYFWGDYYPLTAYGVGDDIWTVFQFHKPQDGTGVILAYRRAGCPDNYIDIKLRDLKKDKVYELSDIDTGETWKKKGSELMKGFRIIRENSKTTAVINFK